MPKYNGKVKEQAKQFCRRDIAASRRHLPYRAQQVVTYSTIRNIYPIYKFENRLLDEDDRCPCCSCKPPTPQLVPWYCPECWELIPKCMYCPCIATQPESACTWCEGCFEEIKKKFQA